MKVYINDSYIFDIDEIRPLGDNQFNFIIYDKTKFKRSVIDQYFYAKTLITSLYVLNEDNEVLWDKNNYETDLNSCDIIELKTILNKYLITVKLY